MREIYKTELTETEKADLEALHSDPRFNAVYELLGMHKSNWEHKCKIASRPGSDALTSSLSACAGFNAVDRVLSELSEYDLGEM